MVARGHAPRPRSYARFAAASAAIASASPSAGTRPSTGRVTRSPLRTHTAASMAMLSPAHVRTWPSHSQRFSYADASTRSSAGSSSAVGKRKGAGMGGPPERARNIAKGLRLDAGTPAPMSTATTTAPRAAAGSPPDGTPLTPERSATTHEPVSPERAAAHRAAARHAARRRHVAVEPVRRPKDLGVAVSSDRAVLAFAFCRAHAEAGLRASRKAT